MRLTNALTFICFFSLAATAAARTLTLDDAIDLGLKQNNSVKASSAAAEAAEAGAAAARTLRLPKLSLESATYRHDREDRLSLQQNSFAPGIPPANSSMSTSDKTMLFASLILRQQLFTGGSLTGSIRRADLTSSASRHAEAEARSNLRRDITRSFTAMLRARTHHLAAEKMLAAENEQLRVVGLLQGEGYADPTASAKAAARVARSEALLTSAVQQNLLAVSNLRRLTGLPEDEEVTVLGELAAPRLSVTLSECTREALASRNLLKETDLLVHEADTAVAIARSGYFPQVSLVGKYLRQTETPLLRDHVWTIGAEANWALFEWGKTGSAVAEATARKSERENRATDMKQSVEREVEESYRRVVEQEAFVAAAEKEVIAAERELQSLFASYNEGYATLSDTLRTEAAVWLSYDGYVAELARLADAHADLEHAAAVSLRPWTKDMPAYTPTFAAYNAQREILKESKKKMAAQPPQKALIHEPATPPQPPPLPASTENLKTSGSYQIQTGAYKKRSNAEGELKTLAGTSDCPSAEIREENGFYKVLCGHYPDSAAARQAAAALGKGNGLIRRLHGP